MEEPSRKQDPSTKSWRIREPTNERTKIGRGCKSIQQENQVRGTNQPTNQSHSIQLVGLFVRLLVGWLVEDYV